MPGDDPKTSEFVSGCRATTLTSAEKQAGVLSRRLALYLLSTVSLLACICAVYFWYLWSVTVRVCAHTYIFQTRDSVLLTPGAADSWEAMFSGLDISSFSALILAFLFTRLAYTGIKNTLWRRYKHGKAFYARAYAAVLFPESFESLCIRFGLLGTLLSFLLAAVSLASSAVASPNSEVGVTLGQRLDQFATENASGAEIATQDPSGLARGVSSEKTRVVRTGQLSGQMFLLLCASLVSTFVGTAVAYMAIPPLNWLNDRAVGAHQRRSIEEEAITDDFFRQIDRTSQRLADFETATTALTGLAAGLAQFDTAVGEASERFRDTMHVLRQVTVSIGASNRRAEDLTGRLDSFEKQSARFIRQIKRFANELQRPLDAMSRAAAKTQEAAIHGNHAFGELRKLAVAMQEPLEQISKTTSVTWRLLTEVRDSLAKLARNENAQTEEIVRAVEPLVATSAALKNLLMMVHSLSTEYLERQVLDHDWRAMIPVMREQLADIAAQLSVTDGNTKASGGPGRNQETSDNLLSPLRDQPRRPLATNPRRSWWRRLFR